MEFFRTNDGCRIAYHDIGSTALPVLILVSGIEVNVRILDAESKTRSSTVSLAHLKSSNVTSPLSRNISEL